MNAPLKLLCSLLFLLLLLAVTTNPHSLPSVALLVPFAFIFGILSLSISMMVAKNRGKISLKQFRKGMIVATLPLLLLVMRSLGQLTFKDLCIIGLLFAVGYFYLHRLSSATVS